MHAVFQETKTKVTSTSPIEGESVWHFVTKTGYTKHKMSKDMHTLQMPYKFIMHAPGVLEGSYDEECGWPIGSLGVCTF